MGVEEEVKKIQRELNKSNSNKLIWLKALQDIKVDRKTLNKTRIGLVVNEVRCTSEDAKVVSMAETLIGNWQKFSMGKIGKGLLEKDDNVMINREKSAGIVFLYGKRKLGEEGKSLLSVVQNTATAGDYVRLTCQEMLNGALAVDSNDPENEKIKSKVLELEEAIYVLHKDDDDEYDDCITTRVINLKKNTFLRKSFLFESLPVQQLATMTAKEMVNFELKKLSDKFSKDGSKNSN